MTTSPLANPTATRELLEEFGLATKHRLGQNFLIDNHVIERICELAELAGDERVLEVGPGVGTLTLAPCCRRRRASRRSKQIPSSNRCSTPMPPTMPTSALSWATRLRWRPEQIEQAAGGEPTVFVANSAL